MLRRLLLSFVLAGAACAGPAPTAAPRAPGSRAAASRPAPTPTGEIERLARQVADNAGYSARSEIAQLDFVFAVEDAGQRVYEVRHRWDLRNDRDRIAWKDEAGDEFEAWLDVASRRAVGTRNGALVNGAELEALSTAAYRKYINDTYWLTMPLKLFDPGVILADDGLETVNDTTYRIIRLSFDGVGLTPGDVYRLYVDKGGYRVHGWQMLLQGRANKPTYVTWEDYRPVGPLLLAHRHRIEGSPREVLLENSRAHDTVREAVFVPPTQP